MKLVLNFKDEKEKIEFVKRSERRFVCDLERAVDKAIGGNSRIITVTGPSCSGKTTASNRLISEFTRNNKSVRVVSVDDFFKNRNIDIKDGGKLDLDSIKSLDLDRFKKFINDLASDKVEISQPLFDMKTASRTGEITYNPGDYDCFLFEGIQIVYPEIYSELMRFPCSHIYLSVTEDVDLNGAVFKNHEVRFLRRLVRDCKFRGTDPDFVFSYWDTVRNNEIKNIEPFVGKIGIKVNTLLEYELCVIKPYVLELLEMATLDEFKHYCGVLKEKFEKIPEISSDYVPRESVFREFIG